MFKTLTPLFAFIIAGGLYFTYVQPTLSEIKFTEASAKEYETAIENYTKLKMKLAEKMAQSQELTPLQRERLNALLPNTIDEIKTLIEIEELARTHKMSISELAVKKQEAASAAPTATQQVAPADPAMDPSSATQQANSTNAAFTPVDISFTVSGTYLDFRAFLETIEHSLVFYDASELHFTVGEGDVIDFPMTVRTYAFKPIK